MNEPLLPIGRSIAPSSDDERGALPALRKGQPTFHFVERDYEVRLARTADELERAQRLRFEVFNRELGEGLRASESTGLDQDPFDSQCDHLLLMLRETGEVVGTYRLQTSDMAERGNGFYCACEYDLATAPREVLENGVELGRACIAREHRRGHALFALFRGLAHYLVESRKRYLYGCCSLTGTDAAMGSLAATWLDGRGKNHGTFFVPAREDYRMERVDVAAEDVERYALPQLFGTYLRYGALVCSQPAVDREFGTIDFLVLFDLATFDVRLRKLFLEG
ncbi:MAG: GNAT family N-acyltransferase [Planctomycetota bacterium]